jgi:methanogenic corrinoid protein MtbC1
LFTIKQASRLTGIAEATLRTWERRYSVVEPTRTSAGYRLYDNESITVLTAMRKLVQAGWSPAEAARAVREGTLSVTSPELSVSRDAAGGEASPTAYQDWFLASAARMDTDGIEQCLDHGFSLGSFEHVVDAWLCPALVALGDGWARGEIDVAGEHAASHAVLRRLSAAFEAAGSRSRGPSVVVGLPPGSTHELGALAFATAIRRVGLDVLYLGPDVPETSWDAAVTAREARAAVLGVVTGADRASAAATAARLQDNHPGLMVASGGAFGGHLADGVHPLPESISAAAQELEVLLHGGVPD